MLVHRPIRIAQCWRLFDTVGTALKVEKYIKRNSRAVKDHLVENPAELQPAVSKALDQELNLFTADPRAVQDESLAVEANERA